MKNLVDLKTSNRYDNISAKFQNEYAHQTAYPLRLTHQNVFEKVCLPTGHSRPELKIRCSNHQSSNKKLTSLRSCREIDQLRNLTIKKMTLIGIRILHDENEFIDMRKFRFVEQSNTLAASLHPIEYMYEQIESTNYICCGCKHSLTG